MRTHRLTGAAAAGFVAAMMIAGTAGAQQVQAQGQVGMGLPGAAPAAQAVQGESDHDMMIGTLAVGFLGRRSMDVGSGDGAFGPVDTHVIGVRYWMDEMLGLDLGLGFSRTGASASFRDAGGTRVSASDGSVMAFMIHGGVPLALANAGHFSFQVIPEANVGLGSRSFGDANENSGSGFHLDLGARAGAEIHFGFMGIPQLSLQGSVGALFALQRTSFSNAAADTRSSVTRTVVGTTVFDNPWNIFISNVSALYYF